MINQPLNELIEKAGGCRYMLVTAIAQRARQLQTNTEALEGKKPVSVAVQELYEDELVLDYPKEFTQEN